MLKDFWFTFVDQLFKSRTVSIFDLIGVWVWIVFVGPALSATLPWWGILLFGITFFIIWGIISGICLYKLTKSFRSEYFYEKG